MKKVNKDFRLTNLLKLTSCKFMLSLTFKDTRFGALII